MLPTSRSEVLMEPHAKPPSIAPPVLSGSHLACVRKALTLPPNSTFQSPTANVPKALAPCDASNNAAAGTEPARIRPVFMSTPFRVCQRAQGDVAPPVLRSARSLHATRTALFAQRQRACTFIIAPPR